MTIVLVKWLLWILLGDNMKHVFDYICEHCGAKNSVIEERDVRIMYEGVNKGGNPVNYEWQGGIPIATDFDHDEPFFEKKTNQI